MMQTGESFSITKTVVYWIIALACFAGCLWMFVYFLPGARTPMLLLLGAIALPVGVRLLIVPLQWSDETMHMVYACALVGSGLCIYVSKLPFEGVVAFSALVVVMAVAALLASRYITHLLINVLRKCLGYETEPRDDLPGSSSDWRREPDHNADSPSYMGGRQIPDHNSPEYYYYMHSGEGAEKEQRRRDDYLASERDCWLK